MWSDEGRGGGGGAEEGEERWESVAREDLTVVTQDGTDKAGLREAVETKTKKEKPTKTSHHHTIGTEGEWT